MKREQRYIVLKLKDIEAANIDAGTLNVFNRVCDSVSAVREAQGKFPLDCVVVESDWPEYETVWGMIEKRVDGGNN